MRTLAALSLASTVALAAPFARAFCGFYVSGSGGQLLNNATQVALMREGTRTVLSMQNNYEGPPEKFALVVPVPVVLQKENVKTLPREVFEKLEQLDAPRLVEYWEQDPCTVARDEAMAFGMMARGAAPMAQSEARADALGVKIEAQFAVGEYEIVILSAENSTGLDTWLRQERYNIPAGAEPYFRPYVQAGSKFFVAKVDVEKVKFEGKQAMLSPLRFYYDAETFSLPVRLGLINSGGKQDLVVHILARNKRYEVANYPNVTIPTNLDVEDKTKGEFGTFYAGLFDKTVAQNPGAVVTEYSWDASSCDPCPGPALTPGDFATLGADALPAPTQREGAYYWFGGGFTLTRIHARYGKEALGADLVFRAAPPIVGGREMYASTGNIEHGAVASSYNNFQARYVIRHAWTGPIACEHPVRGVWGGPPAGQAQSSPTAATKLAFAPRPGDFKLASFVKEDIPEIRFLRSAPEPAVSAPAPAGASASASPGQPKASGCGGCATNGDDTTPAGLAVLAPLAALVLRRRRRAG